MVHSGSASPMKTSPTASPHLIAPPLQVAPPLEPPPRVPSGEEPPRTPGQHLRADLTANSDFSPPFAPSPLDAAPPVVTPATALGRHSRPSPAQDPVNGRTSGRKRTPKACDCCGPNSKGHGEVKASGKGKGRARSRGRGADNDLGDTPKRKVKPQLTRVKSLDLNTPKEEKEEDGDGDLETAPTPVAAETQSHAPAPAPVASPQEGPIRNCAALETAATQKHEDALAKGGEGGKVGGATSDAEMRLLGKPARRTYLFTGRGRGGRGAMTGAAFASLMKAELGRQSESSDVTGSKSNTPAPAAAAEENKEAQQVQQGEQSHSSKGNFGNGDTVNLSDSDTEGEDKAGVRVNGLLSASHQSGTLSSDQTYDAGSVTLTLSNGDATAPADHVHRAAAMEVDASQCPITVHSQESLRDHMMYCRTGTWEGGKEEEGKEDEDAGKDEKTLTGENLEQLTDMVHDYLESFYLKYGSFIPLSETDILEHLKKNGNSDCSKWGLDIKREMTRYKSGLASAPIAGFALMHNKHSLSLDDLGTLEDQNWLNDQIINMYGELIMEATQHKVHFFNSFFYKQLVAKGYDGVKRWTKKVDLFSKWLLLIPIHLEIHWSLVTVTMATKTISYYDSQGIVFRHTTDNILKYLQSEAREKDQASFQKGWKITIIKGIPQQRNDSDCGVFVLEYCRRLSVKQPLQFSQEDMPHIRKRIYKELCDCRLND